MWRAWILSAFAAAVASLAAAEPAAAGEPPVPDAAPVATHGPTRPWSVLGFEICVGAPAPGHTCDLTLPALPPPRAPVPTPPKRFTVLGSTLCLGGAPGHPGCDWQLPQREAMG